MPDPINMGQGDLYVFLIGDIDPGYSCHSLPPPCDITELSLTLLMLGIGAKDPHHSLAPDHLALVTHRFDRAPDFHGEGPPFFICTGS
jgi:hypothetical protein